MILAPILVVFAGYTAASYGYVLMRSWNITPRAWVSPLHPYQWPAKGAKPPTIPPGQLFPGGATAAADAAAAGGQQLTAQQQAQIQNDIIGNIAGSQGQAVWAVIGPIIGKLFG